MLLAIADVDRGSNRNLKKYEERREKYIGEYGYPDWFDEISADASTVVQILENIHDVAHMSVRDIISASGLTQAAFAKELGILKTAG